MVGKKIKRLYRAGEKESMLGGVWAGIADYFEIDPTMVRLAWVIMTLLSAGAGIVGYIIMWMITPRR
jgi:phage shock protein PspC (stress-responsive transcriptional regulator)